MKRGVLVYNPSAGQRDRRAAMAALIARMRGEGLELVNAPTEGPGHATEIVRAFLPRGAEVVAVCGGDGTVSEAASGLAGTAVPLCVLPGGTSNVFARELDIPLDPNRAASLLTGGEARPVRLFSANGRPFLLWSGAGLDARIMARVPFGWKRRLGRAGIFLTALSEYLRYEFPRLEVTVEGVSHSATFAVACHARRYAGNWIIAPDASIVSDTVDVLLFSGTSRSQLLRLFIRMRRGRAEHLLAREARIVRAREVTIRSLERYAVEAHVDGDTVLETPVVCRALPESVMVLVPRRVSSDAALARGL
jgi:diacylglycerol kinase (ATP)